MLLLLLLICCFPNFVSSSPSNCYLFLLFVQLFPALVQVFKMIVEWTSYDFFCFSLLFGYFLVAVFCCYVYMCICVYVPSRFVLFSCLSDEIRSWDGLFECSSCSVWWRWWYSYFLFSLSIVLNCTQFNLVKLKQMATQPNNNWMKW